MDGCHRIIYNLDNDVKKLELPSLESYFVNQK